MPGTAAPVRFQPVAEKEAQRKKKTTGDDILDDSGSSLSQDLDSEDELDQSEMDKIDAQATEENEESADDGFAPPKSPEPKSGISAKE